VYRFACCALENYIRFLRGVNPLSLLNLRTLQWRLLCALRIHSSTHTGCLRALYLFIQQFVQTNRNHIRFLRGVNPLSLLNFRIPLMAREKIDICSRCWQVRIQNDKNSFQLRKRTIYIYIYLSIIFGPESPRFDWIISNPVTRYRLLYRQTAFLLCLQSLLCYPCYMWLVLQCSFLLAWYRFILYHFTEYPQGLR
jgi:hypothetical protein